MKGKDTACTDKHSTNIGTDKAGIVLPTGIVILFGVVVLLVILNTAESLVQYVQSNAGILRIVIRSLSLLGWAIAEWYIVSKLLEYRKRIKKRNKE